jgi:hypothetical protein
MPPHLGEVLFGRADRTRHTVDRPLTPTRRSHFPHDPIGGIMGHGAATEDHLCRDAIVRCSRASGLLLRLSLQPLHRDQRRWPDDVRLSEIEPRFTCSVCGSKGAEVRPHFGARSRSATNEEWRCLLQQPIHSAPQSADLLQSVLPFRSRWQIANRCHESRGGFF